MSEIRGEYWIEGRTVTSADGDVQDVGHEGIAMQHVFHLYGDDVQNIADNMELDVKVDRYGEINTDLIEHAMRQILEKLEESMPERQAMLTLMEQIGCNKDAMAILMGGGNASEYVMKYEGWIAVRSNNAELYGYDTNKQKELAYGINEITYDEGMEDINPDEVEIAIFDHKTKKSWYATLAELENPVAALKTNQLPSTTYNKNTYHFTNPKDSEENKYSGNTLSNPSSWDSAAKNTGVIGPGQQLWRGTSESFRLWLRNQ